MRNMRVSAWSSSITSTWAPAPAGSIARWGVGGGEASLANASDVRQLLLDRRRKFRRKGEPELGPTTRSGPGPDTRALCIEESFTHRKANSHSPH